ncbi:MAG: hypothetical protein WA902_17835, partial [Thermosynechococcaceae cyanobacterium]
TKDFAQGLSYYPIAQSLNLTQVPDQKTTELLRTGEGSWAESTPDSEQLQFDPKTDRQGPLVLGVAVESANPTASSSPSPPAAASSPTATAPSPSAPSSQSSETKPPVSQSPARLVVIGDSDFSSSGPFKQVLNGDLFLNAVTWLGDEDESALLSIRPKVITNRRLDITPRRRQFLSALGVLLPVSALGVAVTLWWQRR